MKCSYTSELLRYGKDKLLCPQPCHWITGALAVRVSCCDALVLCTDGVLHSSVFRSIQGWFLTLRKLVLCTACFYSTTAYPLVIFPQWCTQEPSVLTPRSCSCWTPAILVAGFFSDLHFVWSHALEEDLSLLSNSVTKTWAQLRNFRIIVGRLHRIRSGPFQL